MSSTLNWLKQQCQQNLLTEKWLLCHRTSIGQIWKDRITLSGTATINLHAKTIGGIAISIAADRLCLGGMTLLDRSKSIALVQELLVSASEAESLKYYRSLEHLESLSRLIAGTIEELRLAVVLPDQIAEQSTQPPTKAGDLRLLYAAYLESLESRRLADLASCIDIATSQLSSGAFVLANKLIILIPGQLDLSKAESRFLESLGQKCTVLRRQKTPSLVEMRESIIQLAMQRPAAWRYCVGHGEVNELRSATRRLLNGPSSRPIRFDDVELVYTDASYPPLIYEFFSAAFERLRSHGLVSDQTATCPVTFAEGLPSVYARPGRALRGWLRWIRSSFVQSKAVHMLREGLLVRPDSASQVGYSRLASNLRSISIGFEETRYLPQIQLAIAEARALQTEYQNRQPDPAGSEPGQYRDFGLPALQTLEQMFQALLRLTPSQQDSSSQILTKAKLFLLQCARCESRLDREARNQLLDAIDAKTQSLDLANESQHSVLNWLESLPLETRVMASGPQPGCIHVSRIQDAGFTGRAAVFVLGMDERRFPRNTAVDPILLDDERRLISTSLTTSIERANSEQQAWFIFLSRVLESSEANLQFSFCNRELIEDRQVAPSPALVDLFRLTQNNPRAQTDDLLNALEPATSFVGKQAEDWLDGNEQLLASCLSTQNGRHQRDLLEYHHGHFQEARQANNSRALTEFTAYDGFVPQAGSILDPRLPDSFCSASRLETYGHCPRRFFFRYALGVVPPDQLDVDPEQWLEPLALGSLVHQVFEAFMRDLTSKKIVPNYKRDKDQLLDLLYEQVEIYQARFPCPNRDARDRQIEHLIEMCDIFLREEQRYCEANGARPWVLEASLGLKEEPKSELDCPDPIELMLNDGRSIRTSGRIDRIDRLMKAGSVGYSIWDYKTGSDFGYKPSDPFNQGRKLQSYLYVSMLRHRLATQDNAKASAISFGYFFPNPKTQGLRIQWSAAELKQGDSILTSICDMIASGLFPATTAKEDCTCCDYANVCGDTTFISSESLRKSLDPINRLRLSEWIKLRGIATEEAYQ
jgi:PD-(D/E)XK nuclease superfamily